MARRHAYAPLPPDRALPPGCGLTPWPLDAAGEPLEALLPRIEGAAPAAAIAAYKAWLAANPASPQRFAAWFNLGVVLAAAGDRAAAMIAYRQALALKPDLHQAQVNLGLALEAEGRADEALALWSGALQPDDARLPLLNHRGRLLESRKDYAGAEAALRAQPADRPAAARRGAALVASAPEGLHVAAGWRRHPGPDARRSWR